MRYFSVDFNQSLILCLERPDPNMVRLIPRDTKFFDMFAEMASNLGDGARLLKQTLEDFKDVDARVQQLKDIEHRGDDMTHNILTKLNRTFITPLDREDIYRLASSLDDVLDFVYAAGVRLGMYKIASAPRAAGRPTPGAAGFPIRWRRVRNRSPSVPGRASSTSRQTTAS